VSASLPEFAIFVPMWAIMCIAMMLPTAMPMVLCLERVGARRAPTRNAMGSAIMFIIAYVFVWIASGVVAWVGAFAAHTATVGMLVDYNFFPLVLGVTLAVAGAYQLSPLKYACLRGCRHPASFILRNWRNGMLGAFTMGAKHGAVCVGCCIALMGVMCVIGLMNMLWMAVFTIIMFIEKNTVFGTVVGKVAGLVFVVCGGILIVVYATGLS
jgi:predicted metal-binding membrane protein